MPDIHHSISIAAPIDIVGKLISTGEGLQQWWAEDVDRGADGSVSLSFFNRTTIYRLRLLENSAGRVAWRCETGKEWQDTELVFSLAAAPAGILLDFVHGKWREVTPYFVSCNTTWGGLMFRLKSTAEGRQPGPLFLRDSLAY
jgi:hypothetical protein